MEGGRTDGAPLDTGPKGCQKIEKSYCGATSLTWDRGSEFPLPEKLLTVACSSWDTVLAFLVPAQGAAQTAQDWAIIS